MVKVIPGVLAMLVCAASVQASEPITDSALQTEGQSLRVQLSAHRQMLISSELAARVSELELRAGQRFEKGDKLIGFDCAIQRARLNHSVAAERAASKQLEIAQRLEKLNSISLADVAKAEADRAMARAETGVGRAMIRRCNIAASYSGRVAERKVELGEYVAEGTELLAIYADDRFDVELIAPSRWLSWLEPGQTFQVSLDETGQSYTARITRIGAVVDPLSQSVQVFGTIDNNTAGLMPGMSGSALLQMPEVQAQ